MYCKIGLFFLFSLFGDCQGLLLQRISSPVPQQVDLIYRNGLDYLEAAQNEGGAWSDQMGREVGVVGCALIAILAYGEDPEVGKYHEMLDKALDYLLMNQNSQTGYIGDSMYNHGFATLALAECYGMVEKKGLAVGLQKAVDLILWSQEQNPKGAWRYTPQSVDADTTVTGCLLVALFAARNAGLGIPDAAIQKGLSFIESCRADDGFYGYTSRSNGKQTLTAIAVLCRTLARLPSTEDSEKSLNRLAERLNYRDQDYPFYYEYYMSQALFQAKPAIWKEWNTKNIRYLELTQNAQGAWQGNHGAAYSTAAALLSLALNYKYLPIYER